MKAQLVFSVLARNWFKRVCNEIHNMKNPMEALPSQVFQVVAKSNQRAKGWQRAYFASRPDHRGHIKSPKGTMPFGEAYLYQTCLALYIYSRHDI